MKRVTVVYWIKGEQPHQYSIPYDSYLDLFMRLYVHFREQHQPEYHSRTVVRMEIQFPDEQ